MKKRRKKLKNYMFFICSRFADFSSGMNNKRIIDQRYLPWSANADLGLNNSEYPAQSHPIILKYCDISRMHE